MSKASAMPLGTKVVRFFGTNIDIRNLGLSGEYEDELPGQLVQHSFCKSPVRA